MPNKIEPDVKHIIAEIADAMKGAGAQYAYLSRGRTLSESSNPTLKDTSYEEWKDAAYQRWNTSYPDPSIAPRDHREKFDNSWQASYRDHSKEHSREINNKAGAIVAKVWDDALVSDDPIRMLRNYMCSSPPTIESALAQKGIRIGFAGLEEAIKKPDNALNAAIIRSGIEAAIAGMTAHDHQLKLEDNIKKVVTAHAATAIAGANGDLQAAADRLRHERERMNTAHTRSTFDLSRVNLESIGVSKSSSEEDDDLEKVNLKESRYRERISIGMEVIQTGLKSAIEPPQLVRDPIFPQVAPPVVTSVAPQPVSSITPVNPIPKLIPKYETPSTRSGVSLVMEKAARRAVARIAADEDFQAGTGEKINLAALRPLLRGVRQTLNDALEYADRTSNNSVKKLGTLLPQLSDKNDRKSQLVKAGIEVVLAGENAAQEMWLNPSGNPKHQDLEKKPFGNSSGMEAAIGSASQEASNILSKIQKGSEHAPEKAFDTFQSLEAIRETLLSVRKNSEKEGEKKSPAAVGLDVARRAKSAAREFSK